MKRMSKKMDKASRFYSKLRKAFLLDHPMCHVKSYDCSLQATDIHHTKGRDKYYLDVTTWLPVCRNCHIFVHEHVIESLERGFIKSKEKDE